MGWTYKRATWNSGPGSKADDQVWDKHGVFVFQSGMDDNTTYNAMQSQTGDDAWYRAHFTIYSTGEVLQHYFPTRAIASTPATDGQLFVWIGLAGTRDHSPPSAQWDALILLLTWLFGVMIPTRRIVMGANLRGNMLAWG